MEDPSTWSAQRANTQIRLLRRTHPPAETVLATVTQHRGVITSQIVYVTQATRVQTAARVTPVLWVLTSLEMGQQHVSCATLENMLISSALCPVCRVRSAWCQLPGVIPCLTAWSAILGSTSQNLGCHIVSIASAENTVAHTRQQAVNDALRIRTLRREHRYPRTVCAIQGTLELFFRILVFMLPYTLPVSMRL